ncbi:MAG TPA: LPS assembly lipoprotein LptE [Alphaproteobacteria bacterium]|jgi:LPS-assembly lipoprotein|nr:LPS assembly lipoprotein LptE [Alphaproteobacteria bacterium]
MSLFKSLASCAFAGALTLLAGCGFHPLYGNNSASHQPEIAAQFAAIQISVLPDRLGQRMRNMLIDSLHAGGAANDARYSLTMTLKEAVINLGLQENSTSTRGQVRLTVLYFLIDKETGKTLLTETLNASTGYNILVNQFSSFLSQDDAESQGLQEISDQMTEHLALYFHRNP